MEEYLVTTTPGRRLYQPVPILRNLLQCSFGYSRDNRVANNDISQFMSYLNDGGGIHTIGRSLNTTIAGNYFHDIGAGRPAAHSQDAQSIVYIDNWSCGLSIKDTVVSNCAVCDMIHFYKLDLLFLRLLSNTGNKEWLLLLPKRTHCTCS